MCWEMEQTLPFHQPCTSSLCHLRKLKYMFVCAHESLSLFILCICKIKRMNIWWIRIKFHESSYSYSSNSRY